MQPAEGSVTKPKLRTRLQHRWKTVQKPTQHLHISSLQISWPRILEGGTGSQGQQISSQVLCECLSICAMVKSRYIGDGHPTFNRNPYNGYINPYYWVDDHPLLYGNNGSLDPGTYTWSCHPTEQRERSHCYTLTLRLQYNFVKATSLQKLCQLFERGGAQLLS